MQIKTWIGLEDQPREKHYTTMKKIVFIFTCLIIICHQSIFGQRPPITRDQMLYYFKNNPPFEAEEKIKKFEYEEFDYKSVYEDKELKSYVLKLVDRREYFEYEIKKSIKDYVKIIVDTNRLKDDIWSFLYKRKHSDKVVDSLLKIPSIISQYRDSVIKEVEMRDRKNSDYRYSVPQDTYFVEKFKYSEVYDSLKLWSKLEGRKKYVFTLFKYNDPETIKEVENLIKGVLRDKINQKDLQLLPDLFKRYTSYSFKMMEQVLHKKTKIKYDWSDGLVEIQYLNVEIADALSFFWFWHYSKKHPNSPYDSFFSEYRKINKADNEKIANKFVWDNIPLLKKAALEFAEKVEKEEEYWMKNMPFYKKR